MGMIVASRTAMHDNHPRERGQRDFGDNTYNKDSYLEEADMNS
jgi:hypothetical protein